MMRFPMLGRRVLVLAASLMGVSWGQACLADLLTAGARSGTVHIYGDVGIGQSLGSFSQDGTVPATGDGVVSLSNSVPTYLGTASAAAAVSLGVVSGSSYSLSASSSGGYSPSGGNSGIGAWSDRATFSQGIVISQPVSFTLTMSAGFSSNHVNGGPSGSITFSGPGIFDTISGGTPTYTGTLQPGTYTFTSSISDSGSASNVDGYTTRNASVSGTLSVAAVVPEPSGAVVVALPCVGGLVGRRRRGA